jgi:hypothetical protein
MKQHRQFADEMIIVHEKIYANRGAITRQIKF